MFNTDYDSATNKIGVLDAVARIEMSPEFNIWAGRFLPPSDRANLYGPFYAHEWGVYTDGIQDGYPFVFQGRDNGVVYWGNFAKKVKVSVGAFDGKSATGNSEVLGAARVQIDFWDPEDGYYLNGTYYGDKNLLAIGGATQVQDGHTASTIDFLLEKKAAQRRRRFRSKASIPTTTGWAGTTRPTPRARARTGWQATSFRRRSASASSRFSASMPRRSLPMGQPPSYDQKTTEVNFNYVIKQFNARVMSFFKDTQIQPRENQFLAGRNRPPDPDVTHRSSTQNEGVNL